MDNSFSQIFVIAIVLVCLYGAFQAGVTRGQDIATRDICFDIAYESDLCQEFLFRQSVEPSQPERFN